MASVSNFRLTRIAPTPSGYLHMGNIASFALTTALARATGAAVMLRVDDMDRERTATRYVANIFETIEFLRIPVDMGPRNLVEFEANWSQMLRLPLYNDVLERLKASGRLFACKCSRSEIFWSGNDGGYPGKCRHRQLPLDTPGVAWRLDTEGCAPVNVLDVHGQPQLLSLPAAMRDFVVRKKDGFPAYQTTSVADDVHFGVDLVVRGADLLESTIAQLVLARAAGLEDFERTSFFHHDLVTDVGGRKLSKSEGAQSVRFRRMHGFESSDVVNSVAELLSVHEPVSNWTGLADAAARKRGWL